MSGPRPSSETLDHVVNVFHDDLETLKQFSIVSKSLAARTRTHLFKNIVIQSAADLEAWTTTFPDPMNSPAHHAQFLSIGCPEVIAGAHMEEGGWVRSFTNVVRLEVYTPAKPSSQIFTLIRSLPLLEDLKISSDPPGWEEEGQTVPQPQTSPPLTGTLMIHVPGAQNCCRPKEIMEHIERELLALPNSLHFREFTCSWNLKRDVRRTTALVEACSDTLERVDFKWTDPNEDEDEHDNGSEGAVSVDLTKATKLKEVVFRGFYPLWITMALETITPKHGDLRISIHTYFHSNFTLDSDQAEYKQWEDLDHILIKLSESHAARTTVMHGSFEKEEAREYFRGLLPEAMKMGIVEVLEHPDDDDEFLELN